MKREKIDKTLPEELTLDPVLGTAQAARAVNKSAVHLRRLARAGKFPPPLKIGDRKLGWRLFTIMRHVAEREAAAQISSVNPEN
jgi:predicted DNA-binding transcriptional regulator AlpA